MDADGTSATTQAEAMRKRMVHDAYALYFSAGETAGLFEQHAELATQPTQVDCESNAKRWRTLSEAALDIARLWDRDFSATASAPPDSPTTAHVSHRPGSEHDLVSMAVDAARHLAAAGMHLEDMLPHAPRRARGDLSEAVDRTDATIRQLRHLVLVMSRPGPDGHDRTLH
jgi:hypothetical protein